MPSSTPTVLLLAVPTLARSGLDSPSVVLVPVLFTALAGGLAALLSPVVSARLMNDDDDGDKVCMCCTEKQQRYILLQFMILLIDQHSRFFKSSGQSELLGHFDCMILVGMDSFNTIYSFDFGWPFHSSSFRRLR
jgi:hypothetical protein